MRAKVGVAEDLNTLVAEGVLDLSILYTPQHRPGIEVELMGLGPLALNYILEVGGFAYFRMSAVQPFLNTGTLRLVPDTPEFLDVPRVIGVLGKQRERNDCQRALDPLAKHGGVDAAAHARAAKTRGDCDDAQGQRREPLR